MCSCASSHSPAKGNDMTALSAYTEREGDTEHHPHLHQAYPYAGWHWQKVGWHYPTGQVNVQQPGTRTKDKQPTLPCTCFCTNSRVTTESSRLNQDPQQREIKLKQATRETGWGQGKRVTAEATLQGPEAQAGRGQGTGQLQETEAQLPELNSTELVMG